MSITNNIIFRTVSIGDIPVIQDLSSRIWREHYPGIITHEQIDYMLRKMYATNVIRDEIGNKGYHYVLVMLNDEAVGFISFVHERAKQTVKVSKLYLLPSHHGKGIGRRMLAYVKDDALRSGAEKVCLFVNKSNVKAIRAYKRFGFVIAEAVVNDIGGGFVMDDYRMELDLQGPQCDDDPMFRAID